MASSVPSTAASTELAFYPYEIAAKDLFDRMVPDEVVLDIFRRLDARSLANCGKVSRRWREIASTELLWKAVSLKGVFPSLRVFDASDWLTYFGIEVKAAPVDGRKVLSALKKNLPLVQDDAGLTLLTIPKITMNQLLELAKAPLQGNATPINYVSEQISRTIGDTPTPEYQILITRNVLNGSRYLSVVAQKALVERMSCEMPKVVEALALLIATFVSSGERLYSDNPLIYTRCEEEVAYYQVVKKQLIVGGFSTNGLGAQVSDWVNSVIGVGGVLRQF